MARRLAAVQVVEVDENIDSMEDRYLWCRTERHKWEWERDQVADIENDEAFDRVDVCERCDAVKVKTISIRTFRPIGKPRMSYPKGYLVKGRGRIDIADVYRAQYQRRRPRR